MDSSTTPSSERIQLRWGQAFAAIPLSPPWAEQNYKLVQGKARLLDPVMQDQLIASINGYFLEGAPSTFSVTASVSYPKNLWALIRKWLGLNYEVETVTETRFKEVARNVCPHGLIQRLDEHVAFLTSDSRAVEVVR